MFEPIAATNCRKPSLFLPPERSSNASPTGCRRHRQLQPAVGLTDYRVEVETHFRDETSPSSVPHCSAARAGGLPTAITRHNKKGTYFVGDRRSRRRMIEEFFAEGRNQQFLPASRQTYRSIVFGPHITHQGVRRPQSRPVVTVICQFDLKVGMYGERDVELHAAVLL